MSDVSRRVRPCASGNLAIAHTKRTMLRNPWITEANDSSLKFSQAHDEDDSTASSAYEIVEEEVVETLSDYGGDDRLEMLVKGGLSEAEVDLVEIEEEILEVEAPRLSGIRERDEEEDASDDDATEVSIYEERSFCTEDEALGLSDFGSVTEVEVDDTADMEAIYNAMLDDEDEEVTVSDEDTEVEEVTLHDEEEGECDMEAMFSFDIQITEDLPVERKAPSRKDSIRSECEQEEEASADEFREAIDYVLRQERAVARMILTEEQADKMLHLAPKVMKLIVDHMETCDNSNSPIDWDFLLKIVTPFCGRDNGDSSSDGEDEQVGACSCTIPHMGLICPETTR